MLTYFKTDYERYDGIALEGYRMNEFFIYPIDAQNTLITTRHRAWLIVNSKECGLVLNHQVERNPELYSVLEDLGVIITRRNVESITTMYCKYYSYLNFPPALLIMVPTNRCNNRCVYCHAKVEESIGPCWDMDIETAYKTVDFFFSIPTLADEVRIEFQGGEPLLRYDLIQKIMDYATGVGEKEGKDVKFAVVSNLTLMTDKIAEDIHQRKINLCSSLDGPKWINDQQRLSACGGGTYDKVVYWLKYMKEQYGTKVGLVPTFTVNNINYEEELIDEYMKQGQSFITLRYVNHVNPFEKTWKVRITPEQFFNSWKRSLEYCSRVRCSDAERLRGFHLAHCVLFFSSRSSIPSRTTAQAQI